MEDMTMSRSSTVAAAFTTFAVCLAASSAAHAQPCALPALGWMAGNWLNIDTPKSAQERWTIAPGDVLMGSSFEFPKGKAGYAEIMTIRGDGAAISMVLRHFDGGLATAWEDKAAPMVFAAARCDTDTVTFDGQGDHAGEHMTYTRAGDTLHIGADFLHHGVPIHAEWHMIRAAD
jgi:hypothetical protein